MFSFIIWSIILYCLIRFITNFVIPVIRTTRAMRRQMKDFQDRMNHQQYSQFRENSARSQQSAPKPEHSPRARKEDYIDFEEIK